MAAQERDNESTEGVTEGPADRPGADRSAPDQPPSDQVPSDQVPADQAPSDQVPADQRPSDDSGESAEGPSEPATPRFGPGGTSVMPPVSGGPPSAAEPPRWAARAQVPTPPRVEDYSEQWVTEPPRGVFFPVLITAVVVLLIGVAGLGVWLVLSNRPDPTPTQPTPTSTAPTTTSPSPTTPTTTTSSPTPTGIGIPNLVGQEYEAAALALEGLGLEPQREDIFHDTIPAGQVVATVPTAGSRVDPGTTITVYVSKGPQPTASPTASPSASASPSEAARDRVRETSSR